tara:strand:+ start:1203 stop:1334 length:132 start_codon:yes stop_codon:yes gene_type:complete
MKSAKNKRTLNKVIKDLNKASKTHARQARTLKKVVSSKRKKKR